MWPYPWTHVGTPSHLGHMDRVAATMPSQAHAGAAQEAPDIGQWEGQDVPLVRPSSCNVKGGIPSSRRYLPTYLPALLVLCAVYALMYTSGTQTLNLHKHQAVLISIVVVQHGVPCLPERSLPASRAWQFGDFGTPPCNISTTTKRMPSTEIVINKQPQNNVTQSFSLSFSLLIPLWHLRLRRANARSRQGSCSPVLVAQAGLLHSPPRTRHEAWTV